MIILIQKDIHVIRVCFIYNTTIYNTIHYDITPLR